MISRLIAASAVAFLALVTAAGARAEMPAGSKDAEAKAPAVVVFAAASLKTALDQIGKAWTAETGKAVTFSYAASSAIAKQIEEGAPADLFASADLKWMDYLAGKSLIDPATRVSLLGNTLVLVAPADSPASIRIEKGMKLAEALGDRKLATGDPKSVPAGAYAQAALTSLGVWDEVSPKIAGAENVRAALGFVAKKEAPFGIVYGSDAKSEPAVKVIGVFPEETHPPIVYPFAVTAASKNPAAREFLAFLSSEKARAIFTAQGFSVK